jgi:hypothetical protein
MNSSARPKKQFWTQISVISLTKQAFQIPCTLAITIHVYMREYKKKFKSWKMAKESQNYIQDYLKERCRITSYDTV